MRTNVVATLICLVTAACSSGGGSRADDGVGTASLGVAAVTIPGGTGLAQVVTVEPAQPLALTNVTVRSVLINKGAAPVTLESRICGLNYAGTLVLSHPPEVMKCAGYSMNSTVAPGDSVVVSDMMRVMSRAGAFTLRVQHALAPEGYADVAVNVR